MSGAESGKLCSRCLAKIAFGATLDPPLDMPESLGSVRRFGAYELIEEIARGGMGVVYRGRQLTLNREVAVKLMLHGALASSADVERFRTEARNAAALRHPNIIRIHDVGEWEGQHYFSMDLVMGQNLDLLTRGGPLGVRRAALIVRGVAAAVQHAHDHGILHRDLKPSNVIVDGADHAHVTDFGLSRSIVPGATMTQAGHALGTPSFMAPEQVDGRSAAIGVATDIYGLGALLYQLLTGRPPFTGESLADVLRRVAEGDVVPPRVINPSVPRDLETICLKCMAKEPANRYASAKLLDDDLSLFLRGKPIRARPVSFAGRVVRWSRRNPAVAGLAGTVIFLLVAIAVGSSLVALRFGLEKRKETELAAESAKRLQNGEKLIEFMLGDLSDKLEPVGHLDLLDATLAKVDEFYSQLPADELTPESAHYRAKMLLQYADIRAIQGHLDESIGDFQKAITAYQALLVKAPGNLQWRSELARVRNDLGISLMQKQDYARAYVVFSDCLKDRQALSNEEPANLTLLASVGSTANNLAVACRHLNRTEEAARTVKLCESVLRKWVAADPGNPKAKERLAVALGTVGQNYDDSGQLDQASAYYAEKNELLGHLLHDDPQNTTYQLDRAVGLALIGSLEGRRGRHEASIAAYSQGIDALQHLVAHDATNREWQVYLMNQLEGRGRELRVSGRPEEALEDFQRVVDFSEKNADPARAYPEWQGLFKSSLKSGAEIHQELAARDRSTHNDAQAEGHERSATLLVAKLKAMSN
jgi:tetratricopeptide (TPR) repeat protein/tRNA A-37 threonylcarbamoyl transferase component Bud32